MSSKLSEQMRILARNPQAQMLFQATGRLPDVEQPRSPLIDLLERIEPRYRQMILGVTLSPALGYHSGQCFPTAEALYRWLKPSEWVDPSRYAAKSFRLAGFNQMLEVCDLLAAAKKYPASLLSPAADAEADPLSPAP